MALARARLGTVGLLLVTLAACGDSGSKPDPVTPATATSLVFSAQPGAAVAGEPLGTVEVSVLDQDGDLYTSPVTVTLAADGGAGGPVVGTLSAVTAGGRATFADLAFHEAASGYVLVASSEGLPDATSEAFEVAPAAPSATVSELVAAPASAPAGETVTLTATIRDGYGNPIPGAVVAFAVSGTGNTVTQPSSATNAAGVATGSFSSSEAGEKTVTAVVNPGGDDVALAAAPQVTVTEAAVASIAVAGAGGATVIHGLGNTLQLTATVLPAAAAQAVTWSTSSEAVATVAGGLVTATGPGEVTITATATDGSGVIGTLTLVSTNDAVILVQQANSQTSGQWANATLSGGSLALTARYGPSGNAFRYVAGVGYYGTNSNGFVCLPFTLAGDFSISATLRLDSTPKVGANVGVGVGMTTGFQPTDLYAYALLPTNTGSEGAHNAYPKYVSGNGVVNAMAPPSTYYTSLPTSLMQVTVGRSGGNLTFSFDSAASSNTASTDYFTDGANNYGAGPVYPCLSFNNVVATVTSLVIRDGAGHEIFDSATGTLSTWVPGSLNLAASATALVGQSTAVAVTAVAPGGGAATITAVADDPTVVDVAVTDGAPSSTLTLTGLAVGTTTVTVTNTADPVAATRTRTLAVNVMEYGTADGYGSLAAVAYPAPGATAAYADGELALTFDAPPALAAGGFVDVYALADGALVDRVFFEGEAQVVAGVTVNVGSQLVRVDGDTVRITPHFGKLAHGGEYYVAIPTTAITGTLNGAAFAGLSNLSSVATWRFTVRPAPALGTTVTVDGSQAATTADFRTVGGALMYLAAHPVAGATAVTIDVAAGTYTELVNYRAAAADPALTITVRGPAGNVRGHDTVIQYTNGGNWNGQNARASFYFAGANLVLENLTLRNTAIRSVHAQAETLYFDSRAGYTVAVNNSSFVSHQDTLNTTGRAWFHDSYVEGNTDFIWGTSDVALFEGCTLRVVADSAGDTNTYSIFVARTGVTGAATVGKGYVLLDSTVSVDAGLTAAYGRNAGGSGFYDQVALVDNTFTGPGVLKGDLWVTTTAPLHLGDSTYVGWKASGNTGLGAETATTAPGTAATIADVASEYDTRDHILNRVVTVSGGAPTGYAPAATTWDVSALAAAWGAP